MNNSRDRLNLYALSSVEQLYLQRSGRELLYPGEKTPVIEVQNVIELGRLVALRFIEWVLRNPDGVISLPTGKSPEYFIKFLSYYQQNWDKAEVREELSGYGITAAHYPDTSRLRFVHIDEFYPIDPAHQNSFIYYVRTYYLKTLGIREENTLLIDTSAIGILAEHGYRNIFPRGSVDLSLRDREPANETERLQKQALAEADLFCREYEAKIQAWGGIGFFLGGIGPDGHIAFNIRGSDYTSRTRLLSLNYESAAAAAGDLGGIETSRDKVVITIGLSTITARKDVTAIIIAAGDAKSAMVANAVEQEPGPDYPAAVLQGLPNARFYITRGAASRLAARRVADLQVLEPAAIEQSIIEDVVIEAALKAGKPLDELELQDVTAIPRGEVLLDKLGRHTDIRRLAFAVRYGIIIKLLIGIHLPRRKVFLHTAPHHDDIMLSYLPVMERLANRNNNHFAYMTSGFNAISNHFIEEMLDRVDRPFTADELELIFRQPETALLDLFFEGYYSDSRERMHYADDLLFVKTLVSCYDLTSADGIYARIRELRSYVHNAYAGQKDPHDIQIFKGAIREKESNRKWHILGILYEKVHHMRLHFYTGDLFTPAPTIEEDAKPVYSLLKKVKPAYVTVAFDPEGSGPDTHYKVLQIVAQALRMYAAEDPAPMVWGYRNIWYRFSPAEANMIVPVSRHSMQEMEKMFLNCFATQRNASFPSYEYDGPFSGLAARIQREQRTLLIQLLGERFYDNPLFTKHQRTMLREAEGFVFLKELDLESFLHSARELQKSVEM